MKKDFLVSLNDLDTLQDRLWEFCKEHGYYMCSYPVNKTIELWSTTELVANIRIVTLYEPFEIVELIKQR